MLTLNVNILILQLKLEMNNLDKEVKPNYMLSQVMHLDYKNTNGLEVKGWCISVDNQ